jgi:hypothetical protein
LGLKAQDHLVELAEWVNAPELELGTETALLLDDLRKLLKQQQYAWNEYEIMARFISPLLATIRFGGEAYNLFHQRELSLEHEGQTCKGTVDGLVALGAFDPETPFFFIHEYKRSQGFDADPEGQLLIAMVAAQHLNNDGQPIYGCYIVGTYWRFVLLDGKQYAVSQGYDATDPTELRIIWRILHHTKQIIEERVAAILAAMG